MVEGRISLRPLRLEISFAWEERSVVAAWILRIEAFDRRLLHALVHRRTEFLDRLMTGITRIGDVQIAVPIAAILAFGSVPSIPATAGAEVAFTLAVSHLFVQLLKRWVVRPRPDLPVGFGFLVEAPDRFSFPSGHAAAGLSLFLPIALALPLVIAAPIFLLGFVVGISRCYLGVHYPGDVVAGWSLAVFTYVICPF